MLNGKSCSQRDIYSKVKHLRCSFFLLCLNHILKMYFGQIAFRFQFFHNSLFCEKAYNCENFRIKSLLLTKEQLFLQNSK